MRRFSGVRIAAVSSVLAGVTALVPALLASATTASSSGPSSYLALGDSVAFGYSPLLVQPGVDPSVFVGYPQLAANLFRPKLMVFNASCPGETSTSLISGTRPDNGCQDFRQFVGGLHVSYSGSQLQYAKRHVAANPQTKFVSLTIGANDASLLHDRCRATVPPKGVNACVVRGLPRLLLTLRTNLRMVYAGLRAAGFKGQFVAVTYYSTNYRDRVVTGGVGVLNGVLASVTRAFGGKVADGFGAFAAAAAPFGGDTCKAGLLIHRTLDMCDIHPSPAGAALLARALHVAEGP
jgi:lysophospholipase L1-like esterase